MRKINLPIIAVVLLGLTVLIAWWMNSNRLDKYINHPEIGDIYILQDEEIYAPIKVDRIDDKEIWMRNYIYIFADAVPDREQILDHEFDLSNHLIYDREEILLMYENGKIVEIYRD